ncbi:MAG: nucleotide sugar dehydrogenase [Chloroflexi bacterium]|nr:nucleotide sugar dehydrogenase [Chloroflexota bacterium]
MAYSIARNGEKFELPTDEEYRAEYERLRFLVEKQRFLGREIVVVMGLGFVGAVMAAVVADAEDNRGKPSKFVIGVQRPSTRSFWKTVVLNQGVSPVKSEDPEVDSIIRRCVLDKKTLVATYTEKVLELADVVVLDVQCDYTKQSLGDVMTGTVDMAELEKTFHQVGERIQPNTLVLIETTVPPGTTEQVAYPVIKKSFERRGIKTEPVLAHSYERVMPGRNYVSSVRNFWRVCSGINAVAKSRVVQFLSEVINTKEYPLTVLDRPIESEIAKIVENSYRAAILAFMDEWSTFTEQNGADIVKIINAIRVRPTHSNIMFPGPGIGGYCLPKDGALAIWAQKHIFGRDERLLKITAQSIDINDTRALRAVQLTREALRDMGQPVSSAEVLVLGASYKEDVGDTRNSGAEMIVRGLAELGVEIRVHDPYVDNWAEFESPEDNSNSGHGREPFFKNQEKLRDLQITRDLKAALNGVDAIIFTVRHRQYLNLDPDETVRLAGKPIAIIDGFGLLDDKRIRRYLDLGCAVRGLGRGHIARMQKPMDNRGCR